jgi:soluble lytic murein transglycosylase-like protein
VNSGNADLILAICLVESNFDPAAKSAKGAIGLMGILPRAWLEELRAEGIVRHKDDLYRIPNNIAAGAYVLQKYLSNAKTPQLAHAAGELLSYSVNRRPNMKGSRRDARKVNDEATRHEARFAWNHPCPDDDGLFFVCRGHPS